MARGYLQDVSWVDFYGRPIVTAYSDELGYVVPMKHIIEEHLGLNWDSQKDRMKATTQIIDTNEGGDKTPIDVSLYNPVVVSGYDLSEGITAMDHEYPEEEIPVFNPSSDYLCLPIKELNMFLCSINVSRVSIEVRETLYIYQKECMQVLHDYWNRGFAVNGRTNPSRISSDHHEWCPREFSQKALEKACARYAAFAARQFDTKINAEDIANFTSSAIYNILRVDEDDWKTSTNSLAFIMAFMERAAFDILYFSIERNVEPDILQDVIERNLQNAWENIGTLVISVQSPYTPFPGVGRGSARELV